MRNRSTSGRANRAAALSFALGTAAMLAIPAPAHAQRQSGIQLSPDSGRYFISKDVGSERWAITYNLDDKTVTGNVFPLDGGSPTFLSCQITRVEQAANPADAQYFMDCRAAGPCAEAPCTDQWGAPSSVGPIPGSFLLPTNTRATLAGNVQPIMSSSCATAEACHAGGRAPDLSTGSTWPSTFRVRASQDPGKDYVDPFDADGSYMLDKILGIQTAGSRMPLGAAPLDPAQVEAIRAWILEGAADN
jgi:hypothetical protein